MVGPGLEAGLDRLGPVGEQLKRRWSAMDEQGLMATEADARRAPVPGAVRYDEAEPSTRWTAYGRVGLACALLRLAGREARRQIAQRRAVC